MIPSQKELKNKERNRRAQLKRLWSGELTSEQFHEIETRLKDSKETRDLRKWTDEKKYFCERCGKQMMLEKTELGDKQFFHKCIIHDE